MQATSKKKWFELVQTRTKLHENQITVWFGSGNSLVPVQLRRVIFQTGSISGSQKNAPKPDQTEPQHHYYVVWKRNQNCNRNREEPKDGKHPDLRWANMRLYTVKEMTRILLAQGDWRSKHLHQWQDWNTYDTAWDEVGPRHSGSGTSRPHIAYGREEEGCMWLVDAANQHVKWCIWQMQGCIWWGMQYGSMVHAADAIW